MSNMTEEKLEHLQVKPGSASTDGDAKVREPTSFASAMADIGHADPIKIGWRSWLVMCVTCFA